MIAFTPGEPAGIGPDLAVMLAQEERNYDVVAFCDQTLLLERAETLDLPLSLSTLPPVEFRGEFPCSRAAGTLTIHPVAVESPVVAGELNSDNANYVLNCISLATEACLAGDTSALVTGPIHKGIINQAISDTNAPLFSGHTEYLQKLCGVDEVVMMLAHNELGSTLRVALATTHLPLSEVAAAITSEKLTKIIMTLDQGLRKNLNIKNPKIVVAGLNPHAGEDGYLGREELEVITPTLEKLRSQGLNLTGPLPADTLFTRPNLLEYDAVLAMYHDQGLPVLKYSGFGEAVNITLGLPFLRTSVDHGTALELAGSGEIKTGSLKAAVEVANLTDLNRT